MLCTNIFLTFSFKLKQYHAPNKRLERGKKEEEIITCHSEWVLLGWEHMEKVDIV